MYIAPRWREWGRMAGEAQYTYAAAAGGKRRDRTLWSVTGPPSPLMLPDPCQAHPALTYVHTSVLGLRRAMPTTQMDQAASEPIMARNSDASGPP